MGLFDFIFGDDDEGYPDATDDQAEEAAWKEAGGSPEDNSDTSGNVPGEDD